MKCLTQQILVLFLSLWYSNLQGQQLHLEYLNEKINTPAYDEIAPCISSDGLVLYFTRLGSEQFERSLIEGGQDLATSLSPDQYMTRLKEIFSSLSGRPVSNPIASVFNQDVWVANTAKGDFDVVTHPSTPINNALPNSISAIVPNSNEVIVVNQFVANGGMKKGFSKSYLLEDGKWEFPKPVAINNYHNSGPDVNLTVSNDGKIMILSLERKDAIGRSDLYVCHKQVNGSWSAPKNLGRGVNTPFKESTPHLSQDKRKLFFSSDRGQKDGTSNIFVQNRMDETWQKWTAPRKFIAPINSRTSDSHPYFCPATGFLYFCSNRNNNWDIFRVQIDGPKSNVLNIKGVVLNKETMEPIDNAQILCVTKGVYPTAWHTGEGAFRMTMPWATKATISASKEGFSTESIVMVTGPPMKTAYVKEIQFLLTPIKPEKEEATPTKLPHVSLEVEEPITEEPELGKKIDLRPIYFQQSKAIVLSESYKELDRLAAYLYSYPAIYISISGHTDNQGEKAALQKLSEDRAKAIKDYLVNKKYINPVRIETVGYGADRPINDNSSDRLRRQNRRVEVEVTFLGG